MKHTLLMALGIVSVAAVLFTNATDNIELEYYGVGDYAEDFNLKNVDGKMVSLKDYSDAKGFIVVFTCNTCPYAKMYEQRIMDLDQKYSSKGYPVIAIMPNDENKVPGDSFDEMKKRSDEKNYSFPYLKDETQDVAKAFGATKTPHVFVLNNVDDKYKVEFIGAIDDNPKSASSVSTKYVEDAVDALLDGKKVPKTTANAVGCSIKWSES